MLVDDLKKLEATGKPIRVGVSGAGWIGSGFVAQVAYVPGMTVNVLADENMGLAVDAFVAAGVDRKQIVEANEVGSANDALRAGKVVVTGSYKLAAQLDEVDIVADITPSPAIGAETAMSCIKHGKNIVMVNIEADVTVGRMMKKLADDAGVLYTVSSGDEPGCDGAVRFRDQPGLGADCGGQRQEQPAQQRRDAGYGGGISPSSGQGPHAGGVLRGWH